MPTRARLLKLQRLLRLQEQLHRQAEWKLAALQRQEAELQETQKALVGALNDTDALHGLFVAATARRLKAVGAEVQQVQRARDVQKERVLEAGMRMKHAERMVDTAAVEDQRGSEKKALADLRVLPPE